MLLPRGRNSEILEELFSWNFFETQMIFVYMTVLNGFQNHQAWFLLFFIKDFTVVITAKNPPCISEREGIGSDYLTEE